MPFDIVSILRLLSMWLSLTSNLHSWFILCGFRFSLLGPGLPYHCLLQCIWRVGLSFFFGQDCTLTWVTVLGIGGWGMTLYFYYPHFIGFIMKVLASWHTQVMPDYCIMYGLQIFQKKLSLRLTPLLNPYRNNDGEYKPQLIVESLLSNMLKISREDSLVQPAWAG